MAIDFFNFKELHNQDFKTKINKRISEIVDNGSFVEGPFNKQFEEEFSNYIGSKHSLLVGNGTDAIEIALQAIGLKSGDKVAVSTITFYATIEAIVNQGGIPIFVDIDIKSGLFDPTSFERIANQHKLKAFVAVHIFGQAAPVEEIENICHEKNIVIIEDAAQAHGAVYSDGKIVGSRNNLATFSFYPTKNLSAFGDAGCITAYSDELKDVINSIRNHGRSPNGSALIGRNSRCDHIQAAVLQLKLSGYPELLKRRRAIATNYHEGLHTLKEIRLLPKTQLERSSWHLYPIAVENRETRDKLISFLSESGIPATNFYDLAISQEPPVSHFEGERTMAENMAGTTFSLPSHPFVTKDDQSKIIETVRKFF
jgi:dTDP-4-amino-4,6-dideoxygalactose transaminase